MDFGFIISLQVRHPHLSTEGMSRALRLRPWRSWVAGEPRSAPNGRELRGNWKDSYCTYAVGEGTGEVAMVQRLHAVNQRLLRRKALLRKWQRSGGSLSYYVTVHGRNAMGMVFGPELMSEMARLGIEFGLEALSARQRPRGG